MRDEYIFQHYVPKMYLRHFFISESEERLWCFDKVAGNIFQSSLDRISGEDFFYDPGEFEDPPIERFMQFIEGLTPPVIERLISQDGLDELSREESRILAVFVAVQWHRTRERRNALRNLGEQMVETLEERGIAEFIDDTDLEALTDEADIRDRQNQTIIEDSVETAAILEEKRWVLLSNLTQTPFWTSDNPFVLHNRRDFGPFRGNLGIDVQGIEMYFPLDPNTMLGFLDPEDFGHLDSQLPVLDPDIVEMYNFLQVRQSNRQVFSCDDEFSLAEELVEEYPEISDPDRDRFEIL